MQVVYGHLDEPDTQDIRRGVSYLRLRPGVCACILHNATSFIVFDNTEGTDLDVFAVDLQIVLLCKMLQHRWQSCSSSPQACLRQLSPPRFTAII